MYAVAIKIYGVEHSPKIQTNGERLLVRFDTCPHYYLGSLVSD